MYETLLREWLDTEVIERRDGFSRRQLLAVSQFAAWLDTHGPTLRSADQSAIELLRRLQKELRFHGYFHSQDYSDEISAVLKAADGG